MLRFLSDARGKSAEKCTQKKAEFAPLGKNPENGGMKPKAERESSEKPAQKSPRQLPEAGKEKAMKIFTIDERPQRVL